MNAPQSQPQDNPSVTFLRYNRRTLQPPLPKLLSVPATLPALFPMLSSPSMATSFLWNLSNCLHVQCGCFRMNTDLRMCH